MIIKTVGIVGAGTMGSGLAQLCAENGFSVVLYDALPEAAARARKRIEVSLGHAVDKLKLNAFKAAETLRGISFTETLQGLGAADLVIEAVSEDLRIKQRVFKDLGCCSDEAILATNTSSLPVWSMAQATSHPARVVGLHFFNPPISMKLVEVIKTSQTQDQYFKAAWDFVLALKKVPVEVKDTPGFIVNRVLRPYYLKALRLANEGAPIADIDKAARELGGVPMGPFELMDLIGLDVNLSITRVIYEALGSPERLRPSAIQEWLVNSKSTGRKAGRGFYLYGEKAGQVNPEVLAIVPEAVPMDPKSIWEKIMGAVVEEAQLAHEAGVAAKEDIDRAIKLATNFPRGPFEWQSAAKAA